MTYLSFRPRQIKLWETIKRLHRMAFKNAKKYCGPVKIFNKMAFIFRNETKI